VGKNRSPFVLCVVSRRHDMVFISERVLFIIMINGVFLLCFLFLLCLGFVWFGLGKCISIARCCLCVLPACETCIMGLPCYDMDWVGYGNGIAWKRRELFISETGVLGIDWIHSAAVS